MKYFILGFIAGAVLMFFYLMDRLGGKLKNKL